MNIEDKSLAELESLLVLIKSEQAKPAKAPTKLNGKSYLQIEKHHHCRTCGQVSISTLQLAKGEETTTISVDGHITITTWKMSDEILQLDTYSYKCSKCQAEIRKWPRHLLEERLLELANYNQEAIFGPALVPPLTFRREPALETQLCLRLH